MTFIASVVAKKGVAIIADSLVTSAEPILHYQKFLDYLVSQPNNEQGEKFINPDNIINLFSSEPVFTKDYEEKLFKVNKYTAITTTGEAYINGKNISDLIEEFKAPHNETLEDAAIPLEDKLSLFAAFLNEQIKAHIVTNSVMGYVVFIITHYEKHSHKTKIFKATVYAVDNSHLDDDNYDYVTLEAEQEWAKVVCDGQNKISEKVLYGIGKEMYERFPIFVNNILSKLNLPVGLVPENFIRDLIEDDYFNSIFYGDVALFNLNNLSLKQAVDLASLLMRLEVDFQKYTKNIPTVGGVIKLAVIDEIGFRFLSGDKVEVPKHINY